MNEHFGFECYNEMLFLSSKTNSVVATVVPQSPTSTINDCINTVQNLIKVFNISSHLASLLYCVLE